MSVKIATGKAHRSDIGEIVKIVVQAVLLAMVVRVFLYQPFNIPTGSMEGTLLVGDYLFVSKSSYGYSKYSFPFEAIPLGGRLPDRTPKRGDIAVFRKPTDTSIDYIKRVIGLPGDEIQMRDGVLHINGTAVPKERVDDFLDYDRYGNELKVPRFRETLPEGKSYLVLDRESKGPADDTTVYKVPSGRYFMMGDNRDDSADSRFLSEVGYVPLENFIGRADIIFFSADGHVAGLLEVWKWPWAIRWGRFLRLTR